MLRPEPSHGGVDNQEILGVAFLHEDHFRDEDAGIANDQASWLEHHLETELGDMLPPLIVVVLMQRWFVRGLIATEK